jgi:transcription elongation factor Elf1
MSSSTVDDRRMRCPRCCGRSTIQTGIELRPGVQYLTLRCISCGLVYDAQVPFGPSSARAVIPPLRPDTATIEASDL